MLAGVQTGGVEQDTGLIEGRRRFGTKWGNRGYTGFIFGFPFFLAA